MMHLLATFLATLLALAYGSTSVLHHRDVHAPIGRLHWTKKSAAPKDAVLSMRIAVTSRNIHNGHGHDALMDISDPASNNFGKHWSAQDVFDAFSPDINTITEVQAWISRSGIESERQTLSVGLGSIQFDATVQEAEHLLQTEYHVWEHASGAKTLSCDAYSTPAQLAIDFITPTIGFHASGERHDARLISEVPSGKANSETEADCSKHVTPQCIRELYGIPIGNETHESNNFGLLVGGQSYDQQDLNSLFKNLAPFIPKGTHPIAQSIDGGHAVGNVKNAGDESLLDLNVAFPFVYPQPIRYLVVGTGGSSAIFDDFLDALDPAFCNSPGSNNTVDPHFPTKYWNSSLQCGIYKPPNVISSSFFNGGPTYWPASYQKRQCNEYLKLGLQGTSVLFASGDNGNIPYNGCGKNGMSGLLFPSDCPYITSVGATRISANDTTKEEAAYGFGGEYSSGSGFSAVFARPDYQAKAVDRYLNTNKHLPKDNLGNTSHRAFPDVSAVGQNFVIYSGGKKQKGDGTSAATPLFAAVITRINGMRLAVGKKPLGFLNPILYAHPEMLNDITEGYNTGCPEPGSYKPTPAFYCQKGWDPATGLGTPNFPKMVEYLTSLR